MFLAGFHFDISTFVWVQVACYTACVLWAGYFLGKFGPAQTSIWLEVYSKIFNLVFALCHYNFIDSSHHAGRWCFHRKTVADGKYQAGCTGCYRFLDAANMFGYILRPYCYLCFPDCWLKMKTPRKYSALHFASLFVMSLMIGGAFYFYADKVFEVFFTVMRTLQGGAFYAFAHPRCYTCGYLQCVWPLILASRKIGEYNLLYLSAVVIYVTGNFFLIPIYGIIAAAAVAVLTWTYILLGMVVICSKTDSFTTMFRFFSKTSWPWSFFCNLLCL